MSSGWRALIADVPDFPKPGIVFKDITPVLADPSAYRELNSELCGPWVDAGITHVVGVESRGFIFGTSMAQQLDVGLVLVRKPGKLPRATRSVSYELEYGTDSLEIHVDDLKPGDRVLISDDVLATGGTAEATAKLIAESGATVVGFSFVIELGFLSGRDRLADFGSVDSCLILE
jgi:adenine phosphoribosyltransferase